VRARTLILNPAGAKICDLLLDFDFHPGHTAPKAGCPRVLQFASQPIEQDGPGFFPDGPWLVVIRNVPVNLGGVHNAVLAIVDELQDLSRLPAGLVLRTRP
jgi:hypothetical protein